MSQHTYCGQCGATISQCDDPDAVQVADICGACQSNNDDDDDYDDDLDDDCVVDWCY